jgi:hypothetical protein
MRHLLIILATATCQVCYCQELDIFQNDSIYSKNRISVRTMYHINGHELQKELVTYYNSSGQKIKQFWYWNGDKDFHNVETFQYSKNCSILRLIDSIGDSEVQTTKYYYENNTLTRQIMIDQNNDTCDFRIYPNAKTTIKRWYKEGKPYRYDTTNFEKENVKIEYYGIECSGEPGKCHSLHYRFSNVFDSYGNLVKVSSKVERPYTTFTRYVYDKRNLLIKKQEILYIKKKETINTEYYFLYE